MSVDNQFIKEREEKESSQQLEEFWRDMDKEGKKYNRRVLLLALGGSAAAWIGLTALHRSNPQYQKPENIGEVVSLNVGDRRILPSNRTSFIYSGIPDDKRFLLMIPKPDKKVYDGAIFHTVRREHIRLYFPLDAKQILVEGYQFSVENITPENIILKYLGKGTSP